MSNKVNFDSLQVRCFGLKDQVPQLFENLDQLLTYQQLSQLLNLSVSTLEKYVYRREIPFVRLTRRATRFRVGDIKKWLLSKTKRSFSDDH